MHVKQPYQVVQVTYSAAYKPIHVVFPHEVDILRFRFGDESVHVLDEPAPVEFGEFETDEEYARLLVVHPHKPDEPNPVKAVFRNLAEFEAAFEEAPKRRKKADDVDGAAA